MSSERGRVTAAVRANPYGAGAVVLALAAGTVVFVIAHQLFPYHSSNHDEGVYLQQAAMLLEGRLFLTPGAEMLREAFHPWFFVESDRGLYAKYAPVPAAVFALGELAGGYRLALGAVAALNVGLGYALAAAAFDRRTGLLAAATMAAAPLFLLTSAVFLPYAPTTVLNLLFAVAYVRSVHRRSRGYAALAGLAIGLAFFARPYTAVLFAAPFVAHAGWRLARAVPDDREPVLRTAVIAAVGLGLVGVTLAYNAVVTGSALLFPYEAFAPLDGVGFGRRALLGYARDFTPLLGLQASALVIWSLATTWFTAGPLGTAAAVGGVGAAGLGLRRHGLDVDGPLDDRTLQLVLLGVVVAVVAGNVAFWGNLNILGDAARSGDGFVDRFGPFYHFDLLLPLAAFAAHGVVTGGDSLRRHLRRRLPRRAGSVVAATLLVVALAVAGVAQVAVLGPPVERHAAHTETLEEAYEPFRTTDFDHALVFLPPTYGEWRNHPFQWLRNEPGFDGPAVYATSRNPADDFAVVDAYPDRRVYRYRYHGRWSNGPADRVQPVLERLQPVRGEAVTARTTVAVPDRIVAVSVAVSDGEAVRRYDYGGDPPASLVLDWTLTADGASVDHPALVAAEPGAGGSLPIDGPEELVLTVTLTEPTGGTLTYREALLVRPTGDGVAVLWPPASSVCPLVTDCGLAGTYLPDRPDTRPEGIAMNTTLVGGGS